MVEQNRKKNVKGTEMMGFPKTCDKYPHKFNSGHFLAFSE